MRILNGLADLAAARGTRLGTSDWLLVDQERIDQFAHTTGDSQWIHVDADRAVAGPYGGTVAQGYLILSLTALFSLQVYAFEGWSASLNYGVDRVRFVSPVRVGSRLRAQVDLLEVTETVEGVRVSLRHTIELEHQARPACVAEIIAFLVP